jgi:hypothetical protein
VFVLGLIDDLVIDDGIAVCPVPKVPVRYPVDAPIPSCGRLELRVAAQLIFGIVVPLARSAMYTHTPLPPVRLAIGVVSGIVFQPVDANDWLLLPAPSALRSSVMPSCVAPV